MGEMAAAEKLLRDIIKLGSCTLDAVPFCEHSQAELMAVIVPTIEAARATENEACAQIADELAVKVNEDDPNEQWWAGWSAACEQMAILVRSRLKQGIGE